jgi:hypothetical protein
MGLARTAQNEYPIEDALLSRVNQRIRRPYQSDSICLRI